MKLHIFIKQFLALFLLIGINLVSAQQIPNYITFRSATEKELFSEVLNDTLNNEKLFELFLQTHVDIDSTDLTPFLNKSNQLILSVKSNKKFKKGGKKLVEFIHKELHEKQFHIYKLETYPEALINKGEFNCVTATAYAYRIVTELGFECIIQEEPNHVFLTMKLDDVFYPIETTDALLGYLKYSDDYKKQFVQELLHYKLIDSKKYEGLKEEEIFERIYELKRSISFKDLIALQYYNQGVFASQRTDKYTAVQEFSKAHLLLDNKQTTIALTASVIQYFLTITFEEDRDANLLKTLASICSESSLNMVLIPFYAKFSQATLVNSNRLELFLETSSQLLTLITDSISKQNFNYEFQIRLAEYHSLMGYNKEAIEAVEIALEIKPEQTDLLSFYVREYAKKMDNEVIDEALVNDIIHQSIRYPRIATLADYKQLVDYSILKLIDLALAAKDINMTLHWLDIIFVRKEAHGAGASDELIAVAYQQLALICFERNRISKANNYMNKAIALDPNNINYKQLKAVFNN